MAIVVVVAGDDEVVVARLAGRRPDLALVDALARLQLEAKRHGRSVRVRNPCPALWDLLDLVGLTDLIDPVDPVDPVDPALCREPLGQPEQVEDLAAEEVVPPGDPPV
jgi:hypothetical protein